MKVRGSRFLPICNKTSIPSYKLQVLNQMSIKYTLLYIYRERKREICLERRHRYFSIVCDMIHLLTAIGLAPGGSSTAHIHTQTMHRITQ